MVKPAGYFLAALVFLSGCGYTTQTRLPEHIQSIHVQPVENAIDLSAEVSDEDLFRVYRPGVEVEVTNAIINGFLFDGTLRVARPEEADAVVEAKLVDYRRDPLRYDRGENVQEYRLSLVLDVKVTDRREQKILWQDSHLAGDTTFFITGPRAVSEDIAAARAVEDVSRRVVEKTLEVW